jgi:hypothetical protein
MPETGRARDKVSALRCSAAMLVDADPLGPRLEHQGFSTFFPRVVNMDFEAVYAELRVM